jgi:diguanylate cyclase (GGDEF)-like protein
MSGDELAALRQRLADTEAALQAIRDGAADGIVALDAGEGAVITNVELEAAEATLRHQASHDGLTGLANRTLLMERLDEALLDRQPDETVAVLYCDLDRFKQINDTLGHAAGDEVLVRVADRMRDGMRSFDTVARLAGDEFAIVARRRRSASASPSPRRARPSPSSSSTTPTPRCSRSTRRRRWCCGG